MQVIRKRLWADEGAPASTRYNQDTEQVETTPDGGTTWNPDPGSDPRSNPAYQLPPNPDGNCAAAAGMVVQMKIFVEGMADATLIGIANVALLMLVTMIPGAGWLFGVALAVASGVLAAGTGVIAASFTPTVWEQILCILYCNIAADGTVNQEQLDAIQAEIDAQCGSTVSAGTAFMWQTWGFVGLTNAGVINADPLADCDDCNCGWCYAFDFVGGEEGWVIGPTGAGSYNSGGENWHGTNLAGTTVAADIERSFTAAMVTSVSINFSTSDNGGERPTMWLYLGGVEQLRLDSDYPAHTVSDPAVQLYEFAETEADEVRVFMSTFDLGDTCSINGVTLTGIEANPFGSDNC